MMRLVVCCLRCAPQPLRLGDNLRSLSVGVAIWKPPRAARLRRTRTQSTPPGVCTAWRRAASASAGTRQGVESESVDGIAAANVSVREDAHARVVAEAAAVEFSDEAREAAEHAAANQAWLLNELEALDPPSTGTGQGGRDTPGKENAAQDDVQPRRSDRKNPLYQQMHESYAKLSREGRSSKRLAPGTMQRVMQYRKNKGVSGS